MHKLPRCWTHIMSIIQANNNGRFLNAIVLVVTIIAVFANNLAIKTVIVIVLVDGAPIAQNFLNLADEELKYAHEVFA